VNNYRFRSHVVFALLLLFMLYVSTPTLVGAQGLVGPNNIQADDICRLVGLEKSVTLYVDPQNRDIRFKKDINTIVRLGRVTRYVADNTWWAWATVIGSNEGGWVEAHSLKCTRNVGAIAGNFITCLGTNAAAGATCGNVLSPQKGEFVWFSFYRAGLKPKDLLEVTLKTDLGETILLKNVVANGGAGGQQVIVIPHGMEYPIGKHAIEVKVNGTIISVHNFTVQ
jgi:hypothetical protein